MPKAKSKSRKKAKREIKVPPAPNPNYYHIYRVNHRKTIFWQLPQKYSSEQEAEIEASLLNSLAVIRRKSYFYIVLDGPTAFYLWQGYDVRVGTERIRPAGAKATTPKGPTNLATRWGAEEEAEEEEEEA